ncbi:methylamine dehydrogenase accessory protein MauD [Xanthobacter sediminis]
MDMLSIAVAALWVVVLALLVLVVALSRQVGILFERVAPMGALMTDSGPRVGEPSPAFSLTDILGRPVEIGGARGRSTLVFFLSPTCPVCKKLLPILRSTQAAERAWLDVVLASDGEAATHRAFVEKQKLTDFPYVLSAPLGMAYRVSRLPFAALIDGTGVVRAKGLVNSREQLESLFEAKEMGVASIQQYLDRTASA